jgi:L-histidine N-alpha-methyltransferase
MLKDHDGNGADGSHGSGGDDGGPRLRLTAVGAHTTGDDDGADVVAGLTATPKTLPARYFYAERGSDLFEQITDQPEYYLTRTEEAILTDSADEIAALTGDCELIELGSGSSRKTRTLLEAYADGGRQVRYMPIDVSAGILKSSAEALLDDYPDIEVWGLVGTYEDALAGLPDRDLPQRMALFLGSTLGNMSDPETADFLGHVRSALDDREYFLVGTDLQKPVEVIEAAYNDAAGITAAFNLNILNHLNRRFGGDFDPARFAHRAFYNRTHNRIEMHLESRERQTARLQDLDLTVDFDAGETIRTEISRKFDLAKLRDKFAAEGFAPVQSWSDPGRNFALSLFQAR